MVTGFTVIASLSPLFASRASTGSPPPGCANPQACIIDQAHMGLSSIRSPDPVAASGTFLGVPRRRNVAQGYRCGRMCSEGAGLRRLDGHNLLLGEEAEALVRALVVADDEIGTVYRAGEGF